MRRTLVIVAALALGACTTKHTTFTGALKLGATADENYQSGLDELKAKNYAEAIRFFEYVKTKYPFSKFSALSELRLADVKFNQDRYVEAAEAYKQFVQLHPTHEDADYAEFRSGFAYYKDSPGDFALFPPAEEKDQRQAEKAAQALADFVQTRPESKYLPEAKKVLAEVQTRLAAREWYVAEFYYKRSRWAGAAGRYETMVEKYPGSRHEADALWKLASAALKIDEKHRARKALQQLVVKYPGDKRRPDAEKLLASIR